MVSKYMHDPGQRHWEAVKWVLRYIKGTIDVGLVFEKDSRTVSDMLIPIMLVTSTNAGPLRGMYLHYLKHRLVSALFYSLPLHCLLQRPSTWP